MIRSFAACLLVLGALAAGDAPPSHQGTVIQGERSFSGVWIISETMDGVVHTLDSKRDSPPTTLKRGTYQRVEYVRPNDVTWLRAEGLAAKGAWAEAATQYLEAAKSRESWYVQQNSLQRAAEALVQAGKPDEALKALDALLAANAKSAELPRLTYLRGQALHKKGDAAGALKAYSELGKREDWGVKAVALGALGQGDLFTADAKHGDAAKALAAAFAKLDPTSEGELFGQVGVALSASQQAAGQTDAAIATLRRLAYGSADAVSRARAQLAWAKLLSAADDTLFLAFDHAVIAMTAPGAVGDQAGQLARQLGARIDKLPDAQASAALKAEYRRYLSR